MKKRFNILLIGICLLGYMAGHSQTKKAWLKAANESLVKKDYYSALSYFSEALEFDTSNMDVIHQVAESARNFNAYTLAESSYQRVLDKDAEGKYPSSAYYLAEMKLMQGKYDDALNFFNIYLGENSDQDSTLTVDAKKAIESINYAKERIENYDTSTSIERLGENVNSPYSEFSAVDVGESIYYSSHQFTFDNKSRKADILLGKIMQSTSEENGEMVDGGIDIEGKTIANATFNRDGSKVYYSVCDYVDADNLRCDLYYSDIVDDTVFTNTVKLPEFINDTAHTSTQAHIAYDDFLGAEYLFFVSDRKGGKGKLDIYYTIIDDQGGFSEITNVEGINSPQNEITPYFDVNSQTLYFSALGRLGLGGYDIYSADAVDGEFKNIKNLDANTNSSYHDTYYKVADSGDYAYFSSNRKGSLFLEEGQEACCFDVYKATFDITEILLNAMTYDLLTQDSLTGVTVKLIDAKTGRELDRIDNLNGKDHKFKLVNGREYLIVSEKEGFYPDTTAISTVDIKGPIEKKIYLDSDRFALDVLTFNKRSKESLEGVKVRLIDLTDQTIADQIIVNEDGNDFLFLLEPNKNYRIEASKYGYVTDLAEVSTIGTLESKRIKKELYLDSFDLNQYLPVDLYFDNDMPDPASKKTSTNKVYSDLYYDYIKQEETFQKKNPQEREQITNFFENSVKPGYVQMQKFYDELYKSMKEGVKINLTIKGHTSPIAINNYNLVLGQRRVMSVKNDMKMYRGGILREYLENGQIKITDISFGEEIQKTNASDSASNKRSSVFSVDASLERRVEIIKATEQ